MGIEYIKRKIYERNLKKRRQTLTAKEEYDRMASSIASIVNTPGFSEIVEYWEREMALHKKRLSEIKTLLLQGRRVDQAHVNTVLVSHELAEKFLTFLVNVLDGAQRIEREKEN